MATSYSEPRGPVMSIRTQPAEEDNLRAEIEAASRTQHEIVPRYSWHSAFMRRDNLSTPRQAHSFAPRDTPPNQLETTGTLENDGSVFEEYASMPPGAANDAPSFLKHSSTTRRPWRQLTKRIARRGGPKDNMEAKITVKDVEKGGKQRNRPQQVPYQGSEVVAGEDRAAQHAQFNAWLEERLEEQNSLADLSYLTTLKSKRTIRPSVYGSLSSTKSFLKGASKKPLGKLRSCSKHNLSSTPHVHSFETKDQLRQYLNQVSPDSPLSPLHPPRQAPIVANGIEPVELSAGPSPLPAELDGTIANAATSQQPNVSRVSSPSIPDLPPYVDDKKFRTDIAKDQGLQVIQSGCGSSQDSCGLLDTPYTCNSCEKQILSCEVYDFCAVCDTGDRVLCTDCARKGPCCQHELEGLLRACALGQAASAQQQPIGGTSEQGDIPSRSQRRSVSQQPLTHEPQTFSKQTTPIRSLRTGNTSDFSDNGRTDSRSVQQNIVKELSILHREQDLVHRERELALRVREIELRDQQATLREREAIVQQKNDSLIRNLESLVPYQDISKRAFIGAQFQSQHGHQGDDAGVPTWTNEQAHEADSMLPNTSKHQHSRHTDVAGAVADAEAAIRQTIHYESNFKSCPAQKRKKNGASTSTGSSGSTPAASSSSEQTRKPLSRGNSERDASQDEEEEEGNQRYPKKNKQDTSPSNGPQLLFACPFSKHNPLRFSSRNMTEKNYRGCGTHYLPDVSRLKQHLKRVHWQPEIYCPRCYEEFSDTAKLTEHARAQVVCHAETCPFPEKMDKVKQEKIHIKRPRVPPDTVWYDIYKVLFPGSPLPDSPYADTNDKFETPSSATPQSSVNIQAVQMLSTIFNDRLNQYEGMQGNPLRPLIDQTLMDSFAELLGTFSLSSTLSPGAGPSIMVSPVSRSSSDDTQAQVSPLASPSKSLGLEGPGVVTNVIRQSQQVPQLQQPRPPRPRLNTALQVPQDHHRSPSGHSRQDSTGGGSPADFIFGINILPHIQDDPGYDDECRSYEQGDDLQAMAFVDEPPPPSCRNKSVMSIDSGYGSGRSNHHANQSTQPAVSQKQHHGDHFGHQPAIFETQSTKRQVDMSEPQLMATIEQNPVLRSLAEPEGCGASDFQSYSSYLDPVSQEILGANDYPFSNQHNPWNYL